MEGLLVKGDFMLTRTLLMSLSSMVILVTSFCVHKKPLRDVSSENLPDITKQVKPLDFKTVTGHQLRYFEDSSIEFEGDSATIIQVLYICAGSTEPVVWRHELVKKVWGLSKSDKNPKSVGLNQGVFTIVYEPLWKTIDFSNKTNKSKKQESETESFEKMTFDLNYLDQKEYCN